MTTETRRLIYVAPLLEHESDLFKVGHSTIAGKKGRRSKLRLDLSEPKLELYSIVDYPAGTTKSTVVNHERALIWMLWNLSLFRRPTPKFKFEVISFRTTPGMRFWNEREPNKRDLSFRVFLRAFLLGEEGGSSHPIPPRQVLTTLEQYREQRQRIREVRLFGHSVAEDRERNQKERETAERLEKARLAVRREQEEKEREAEKRREQARLVNPKRIEAHGRIGFF